MWHSQEVGKVMFFIKGIFHLFTTHHFLDSNSGDFSNSRILHVVDKWKESHPVNEYGGHVHHH